MEFKNFEQFNDQFRNGKFDISNKEIVIDGLVYKLLSSSSSTWEEVMNGKPGIIIYSTGEPRAEEAKKKDMDVWLALIWVRRGGTVVPVTVRPTTKYRATHLSAKYDNDRPELTQEAAEPNIIGDIVRVKITNLPASSEMKGKVDTGATISSLHAEKWSIDGQTVKFITPELSPNVITVPLVDQQAVRSADGGTEYRPVIELNIKINGKLLQGVQFNLNDRGQMEFPMLVGQNILEKGKFLINPSINEEVKDTALETLDSDIDWDALYENLGPIELPVDATPTDFDAVYKALRTLQYKLR